MQLQSFSAPRFWTPQDSPRLFLKFLGISSDGLDRKSAAGLLREMVIPLNDSDLETLAHQVASHRRAGGDNPEKIFGEALNYLKHEREAMLHPKLD